VRVASRQAAAAKRNHPEAGSRYRQQVTAGQAGMHPVAVAYRHPVQVLPSTGA